MARELWHLDMPAIGKPQCGLDGLKWEDFALKNDNFRMVGKHEVIRFLSR